MSKLKYKKKEIEGLIQLSQKGDIKALEELIRRVQKNVYSIFSYLTNKKQDISDLTQEALIKMAKNIDKLKDINNFKYWLDRIIINIFYDFLKKNSKNEEIIINEDKLLEIKDKLGCEPGEKCLLGEIEKCIKASILNLPDNLRLVIVLREFENLTYEEIANLINVSLGTVKSRIARARIKLQKELKEFI